MFDAFPVINGVDMYDAAESDFDGGPDRYHKNRHAADRFSFHYDPLHYHMELPSGVVLSDYSEKAYRAVWGEVSFYIPKSLIRERDGIVYVHRPFFMQKIGDQHGHN